MRNQIIALAALLLLSVCNTGCKEDTIIKANVTPSSDFILADNKIGDTLTILSKTIFDDSIAVGYNTTNLDVIAGIGTVNDPFFGRTNWGSFFQVVPTGSSITLPNNPDSCVLILPYAHFSWGDTTNAASQKTQSYSVYLVTEDMSKDSLYYTNRSFNYDPIDIGSISNVDLYRMAHDSVTVSGATRNPMLRIRLKDNFMNKLYAAGKNSTTTADFLSTIKGIYVAPTNPNNNCAVIPYFYLNGTTDYQRAAIALYYNDGTNPANATFFNFTTADCAHDNYIKRQFSSNVNTFLQSTALSDSIMLMQNEPGAAFDLRIPYLKNLPLGIINKAQLVITMVSYSPDGANTTLFSAPPRLYPIGVYPQNGGTYTILDRFPTDNDAPLAFIDGTQRLVSLPNGITVTQYFINIPREVQKTILNKADELHLRINGTVTYPGAYRIIAGGSHSQYKARLNIVYSKIN